MARVAVVGAALIEAGRWLVAQRSATMSAPLAWEFPGGKVAPGESPERALARELAEELGIDARIGEWIGRGETASVVLDVYLAERVDGVPEAREHAELRWLGPDELSELAWAEADVPIVAAVASRLAAGG